MYPGCTEPRTASQNMSALPASWAHPGRMKMKFDDLGLAYLFFPCLYLSPPQRLLLVNTSERKIRERGRWKEETAARGTMRPELRPAFPARCNFPSSQPPRSARCFPSVQSRRDCRRPLQRRSRECLYCV